MANEQHGVLRGSWAAARGGISEQGNLAVAPDGNVGCTRVGNVHLLEMARRESDIRRRVDAELFRCQEHLESLVRSRTADLERVNQQLRMEVEDRAMAVEAERSARLFADALREASVALISSLDFDQVLDRILGSIARVIPYDTGSISLLGNGTRVRTLRWCKAGGQASEEETGDRDSLLASPAMRWMSDRMEPLAVGDVGSDPRWAKGGTSPCAGSWVGAPAVARNRVVAFISLHSFARNFYSSDHANQLVAFATHAALALENARLFEEVNELAVTDSLTGIYNRRHFMELAERQFNMDFRHGRQESALMLDIDHFKQVNDRHGHGVGDIVLRETAGRLRECVRRTDIVGRYGGDEFVVVLPETGAGQAFDLANTICGLIGGSPVETEGGPVHVTASIGVAGFERPRDADLSQVLKRADQGLYFAKLHGRNMACHGSLFS